MNTINTTRSRRRLASAGTALLLGLAAVAHGQDALGTGNALDANTRIGGGGVNARNVQADYRARNLLVTGDVPGGRGFRGSVGYRAAGDFEGRLGSDDLFRFRAVSALSAPQVIRYGATIQNLRFGEQLGDITYRRSAAPRASVHLPQTPTAGADLLADRIRLDRVIQSTSITERRTAEPSARVIGELTDPDGRTLALSVSSLRGIVARPTDQETRPDGFSEYDWLRLKQDETEGRELAAGSPFETRFDRLAGRAAPIETTILGAADETARVETQVGTTRVGEYDDILERVAERFAAAAAAAAEEDADAEPVDPNAVTMEQIATLTQEYDTLRERLKLGPAKFPSREGAMADAPETGGIAEPTPIGEAERIESLRPIGARPSDDVDRGVERFGIVLRHGERIERLASGNDGRFNELLRAAEDRLRSGEYFWAERRFLRALRFIPGHPLATAGLGHAQLGAGLYDSAALTLRSLFTHQPEMIDTRYDESLLPNRVRLRKAIEEIRTPSEMKQGSETGFLLAYIGHQLSDADLVAQGLEMMEAAEPGDALRPLLEAVWIEEDAPAPNPTPSPGG